MRNRCRDYFKNADIRYSTNRFRRFTETKTSSSLRSLRISNHAGVTVIYISHKLDEIRTFADEIHRTKGRGARNCLLKSRRPPKEELVRYMVGHDVEYDYKVGTSEIGEVAA